MVALVVLPGMDGAGRLCSEFMSALGGAFKPTVICYPPDRALGYEELERLVRANLPADRPYILLGESFSGPIAISIAASSPPDLAGLVLCCSFARNPRPALGAIRPLLGLLPLNLTPVSLLSALLLGRFATAPLRAALRGALAQVSTAALRARLDAVLSVDVLPLLAPIRVPVLYLRGTEDHLVPRSCSEAIAQGAPQTRIVDIDAPHFLLQAAPSAAAAAVQDFAGGIVPRTASSP